MTNLTTLAAVKQLKGIKPEVVETDQLITALIVRCTDFIQRKTNRVFPVQDIVNRRVDGSGSSVLVLPVRPILSVSALSLDDTALTTSTGNVNSSGFFNDDLAVYLRGSAFTRGRQNIVVSYKAGYASAETANVPAGNSPTLRPTTGGNAVVDAGVTLVGTPLVSVIGTPNIGQYKFSSGAYQFNTAQANLAVTMSYYFIPPTIEQACLELVLLKLEQRTKIGTKTKSLATESITFEDGDVTPSVKGWLEQYTSRVPI